MTSKNTHKGKLLISRLSALVVLATTFFVLGFACNEGREGDRCNPDLFAGEDECGSGLSCQTPSTCVESYCCPMDPTTSKDSHCNGMACPTPDAGTN